MSIRKITETCSEVIYLDECYSTTRLITLKKPNIKNKPEDKFENVLFLPEGKGRKGVGGLRTQGIFKQSMPDKPLITIITVVFNGEKYLEETIHSVIKQTYDNVEYIIIDGGSTDGTLNILMKYEGQIDYWVSERDNGIYYAMNKGISLSTGKIIGIVNADDCIYQYNLAHISHAFINNPDAWYTYGAVDFVNEKGQIFCIASPVKKAELHKRKFRQMPYPHQTMYVSIEAYKKIGLFDLNYKLRADYDFLLKLIKCHGKSIELLEPVGFFRTGGQSGGFKTYTETRKLLKQHGLSRIYIEWYFIKSIIKLFAVFILPYNFIKFLSHWKKKSTFKYL